MSTFILESLFTPTGDQPQAISQIQESFDRGDGMVTLLGATGTGKTFTMANIIEQIQKPTLILSHNKTLAAQLATEFKHFFPNNAVHYFVSYFDYYQPESYLPDRGVYIEKEATINKEIEMYRLATMASLLSRKDVIVVASVSAIYGTGNSDFFSTNRFYFEVNTDYDFDIIKEQLIRMQYKPVFWWTLEAGMFEIRGEMIDIYSSTEKVIYRLIFNDHTLELIQVKDSTTYKVIWTYDHITLRPATQFLQNMKGLKEIIAKIQKETEERVHYFEQQWLLEEASRLKKRVAYDMKMIEETGFVNGIENYSPYFEERLDGAPPHTLFDYFPDDFLCIVDESHMTIPQFAAMPRADKSRRQSLVDHGFRLPSSRHHRPLDFDELRVKLGRVDPSQVKVHPSVIEMRKKETKTLFVSATPAEFELTHSRRVVQQVIRPTGLLDPLTYIYPKSWDYHLLTSSLDLLLQKKPRLKKFMEGYEREVKKL